MKLAAFSLVLGIGVAMIGVGLGAGLTAASEYPDAGAPIDELSRGMLEIDRHHGLVITLDSTLGSAALWQTAFGDLTGDGIDDLVIGLPMASPDGIKEAGMVAVIYGRHGGFDGSIELSSLDASDGFLIKGSQPGARLGWSLAMLPDFNDSGFSDLVIGAPGYRHETGVGAAHLLFGQPDFPARMTVASLEAGRGFTLLGGDGSGSFGFSMAALEDFSGSGYSDLAIGDPDAVVDGQSAAGSVQLLFGGMSGFPARVIQDDLETSAGVRIEGDRTSRFLGLSLSAAGDLNNDGQGDLLIGAPGDSDSQEKTTAGAAFLVYGGACNEPGPCGISRLLAKDAVEFSAGAPGDQFGLAVGWVKGENGPGHLVIGAPMSEVDDQAGAGAVYVIPGNQALPPGSIDLGGSRAVEFLKISGEHGDGRMGWSVYTGSDFNLDGRKDLVVGGPTDFAGSRNHPFSTRYLHVPGRALPVADNDATESEREFVDDSRATQMVFDARGLTRGRGTANWAIADAGRLAGDDRAFVLLGERPLSAESENKASRLYAYPAQVRSEHGPEINGGEGIDNQILRAGETVVLNFVVSEDGQNPDEFDYQVGSEVVTGENPALGFEFGGTGTDRTLTIESQDATDSAGLLVITVIVTDPGGNATQESFVLGFSHEFGPEIDPLIDMRTYNDRNVSVLFSFGSFPNIADGGSSEETVVLGEAVNVTADTGGNGFLDIASAELNAGQTIIWVYGAFVNGNNDDAYSGFFLEVFEPTDPFINDGEGIASPQTVTEGQTLTIEFIIGDLVDPPEDLAVRVFSGNEDIVATGDMTLGCTGENCTLQIPTDMGTGGTLVEGMQLAVCYPDCFEPSRSSISVFDLDILVRQPPRINGGMGIAAQSVTEGQSIVVPFTIEDDFDDPDTLQVAVFESNEALDPGVFDVVCVAGDCELTIAPALGTSRVDPYEVLVEVTNSDGLFAQEAFDLIIDERQPPTINGGMGIAGQSVTEGQSVVVPFTIEDDFDDPDALNVTVTAIELDDGLFTLTCATGDCELAIDTNMGMSRADPFEIVVEATNSDGLSGQAAFDLTIDERPAPTINDGAGVEDQTVVESQSISFTFTIQDEFDDAAILDVDVFEAAFELDASVFVVICDGEICELTINTETDMARADPYEVIIEVSNPDSGLSGLEGFGLLITDRPLPTINEGAGIADKSVIEGQSLTFGFSVEDEFDDPDVLEVGVSEVSGQLDDSLLLGCDAGTCELTIMTELGMFDPDPYELAVEVTNPLSGLSDVTLFNLLVLEREGPLINGGDPIPDRAVDSGQTVEVVFPVSDQLDDPDQIAVSASSMNEDVLPQDALALDSPCALGECSLLLDIPELAEGIVEIVIVAVNSDGIESQSGFNLLIELQATPPVINKGEPLANLLIYEGQSQSIEFSVTEEIVTETLSVLASSDNELIIGDDDLLLSSIGNDLYELVVQTRIGATGTAGITVTASNLVGEAERTFEVEVRPRPAPQINGSAGLFDRQGTAGTTLEFSFSVTDLIDPATEISTTAQSMNQAIIPADSLSLTGTGAERILSIDIPDGQTGVAEIVVVATNSAGRSRSASFDLTIGEGRQPPVINNGQPLEDQMVMQGGTLTIVFDVEDAVDAPELISVDARSDNQDVMDDDAIEIESDGVTRELTIDATEAVIGSTDITVEAVNSAGLVAVETFQLLVVEAEQTELSLEIDHIDGPRADDVYLVLSVENIGAHSAALIELAGLVAEGEYSVLGGYSLAPSCSAEDGEVTCDSSLIAPWVCGVEEEILVCTLTKLPVQGIASLVMHLEGDGVGQASVAVEARNSLPVSSAEEIGN